MICIHMAGLAIVLALLMPTTEAQAQSRVFYGADGRVSGRSSTSINGMTTYYNADGRVTHRTSTSGNVTTIYDAEGRKTSTVRMIKPVIK